MQGISVCGVQQAVVYSGVKVVGFGQAKAVSKKSPSDAMLRKIRQEFIGIASPATAYDKDVYEKRRSVCPLTGHCGPVTYLLQKLFGGDILSARVTFKLKGKTLQETHYWNRIGNREVDLSGSQYGGDGMNPLDAQPAHSTTDPHETKMLPEIVSLGRRRIVPQRKTVNRRFMMFERQWRKLQENLQNKTEKG